MDSQAVAEKPTPLWSKVAAGGAILVLVVAALLFRSRLGEDFIPIDGSRVAPNILASVIQLLVVTPFAVLLWPPTRRRLHQFADRKLAALHTKLDHNRLLSEEIHHKLHTGKDHPRVVARMAAGEHPTPPRPDQ
jgi:hypothetical protein